MNDETIRILTEFLRDLHVEDTATFFNLASEALKFYSVYKQVLLKGEFQLRKWESNDFNLQKSIREKEIDNSKFSSNPSTDDATYDQYQLGLHNPQFRKVLGMNWDINKFQFSFDEICECNEATIYKAKYFENFCYVLRFFGSHIAFGIANTPII